MHASKEHAKKARKALDDLTSTAKLQDSGSPVVNDALATLRGFIDQAERKLPTEKAYTTDAKRRKDKKQPAKV